LAALLTEYKRIEFSPQHKHSPEILSESPRFPPDGFGHETHFPMSGDFLFI
jgi:hypothetical protein